MVVERYKLGRSSGSVDPTSFLDQYAEDYYGSYPGSRRRSSSHWGTVKRLIEISITSTRDVITATLEGVPANIIFGLILLSLISLASFLSAEWSSSFFLFLPIIPLHNIITTLVYTKLYKMPKGYQIKRAEKELPAFMGIYLIMFLIFHLCVHDLASNNIWQSKMARKAFEILLVIVVLNPDILPHWIPLYHSNPTRRAVMAFLGSAIVWLAYPALAEAGVIGTALVYSLAGFAIYALLWKFVGQRPRSAVKSAEGRKRGSVAFMIDESERYYIDLLNAKGRREEKKRRAAIRIGRRTMRLDSSEEEEIDEIGPVPDALFRPSNEDSSSAKPTLAPLHSPNCTILPNQIPNALQNLTNPGGNTHVSATPIPGPNRTIIPDRILNVPQNLTAARGNANVNPIPTIPHLGPPPNNFRGPPRYTPRRRRAFTPPPIDPHTPPFPPPIRINQPLPDRVQYMSDIYNTLALGRGRIEAFINSLSEPNFLFLSSLFRFFFEVLNLYITLAFLLAIYHGLSREVRWLPLPDVLDRDADSFREFSSILAKLFHFREGWMSLPYSKEGVALVGATWKSWYGKPVQIRRVGKGLVGLAFKKVEDALKGLGGLVVSVGDCIRAWGDAVEGEKVKLVVGGETEVLMEDARGW